MARWDVPDSWKWAVVDEVAEVVGGGTPKANDPTNFSDDGIPWLTPADLSGYQETYISRGARALSHKGLSSSAAKMLPKKTVLYTSRAPIGYCAIASNDICTNQGFKSLVLSGDISSRLVRHYLLASKEYAESLSSGSTFKELSGARMKGIEVPVPPLNEQRRIADKIDVLQAKSRRAREALETVGPLLEKFRQSVLAAAFRGDLTAEWRKQHPDVEPAEKLLERIRAERRARWEEAELAKMRAKGKEPKNDKWKAKYKEPEPVDTTGLPELPEGWCWTNLEEIIIDGPQNGLYVPKSRYGKGTRILRIDDYQAGWTREVDELQRVMIDEVDVERYGLNMHYIVVNRVNSMTHLGKTTVIKENMLPLVFESNMMAFLTTTTITPEYIEHYLNSDSGRYELVKNAKHAVNQASINQKDVQATLIPLPPEDESRIIASSVDNAFKLITQLSQIIQQSESDISRLDQSILANAFRGELVPQDPNDEPASVLLERIKTKRNAAKGKKVNRKKK